MFEPGDILAHDTYYMDGGVFKRKYLVVLSIHAHGDMIYRLLTSRQHGRARHPPCYRWLPYPGFYLGIICGELPKESWVDLRECDDMDKIEYSKLKNEGILRRFHALPTPQLSAVIEFCVFAEETTPRQQQVLMLAKQALKNRYF